MSSTVTSSARHRGHDHFEPEAAVDPHEQRRMRGHLEQIDYAAYASNREVISHTLTGTDGAKFQRLAVAAAHARAQWVAAALEMTQTPRALSLDEVDRLGRLRAAFEELTEVYEAMRRMVERGYLGYRPVG
jgi:hypothetical protein